MTLTPDLFGGGFLREILENMTTEDPKYKIIAAVSTVLIIAVMAFYSLRKQHSIENLLRIERLKSEEIRAGRLHPEQKHEETKRQKEILKFKK